MGCVGDAVGGAARRRGADARTAKGASPRRAEAAQLVEAVDRDLVQRVEVIARLGRREDLRLVGDELLVVHHRLEPMVTVADGVVGAPWQPLGDLVPAARSRRATSEGGRQQWSRGLGGAGGLGEAWGGG